MVKIDQYFVQELLAWYERNKRDLPWRQSNDPYHIWVSEIMLQQTRVDTVIPYFNRFIEQFPTVDALAEAPEEEVLKCWEGLGYYSRARNLHAAVKEVQASYGSKVPSEVEEITKLKGVGPYTAGAVLSIAYGRPEPAVDGNVMRVLSRFYLLTDDIAKVRTRTKLEEKIREIIPHYAAGDFNQALMELGALVCTPRSPGCLTCPVMMECQGRLAGVEEELPVKTKAKPPKPVYKLAAYIEGEGEHAGKFLIRKRPAQGLLASMWELPHVDLEQGLAFVSGAGVGTDRRSGSQKGEAQDEQSIAAYGEWLIGKLLEEGIHAKDAVWMTDAEHTFSHLKWFMKVYRMTGGPLTSLSLSPEDYRWIDRADMEKYAFPNVFIRILDEIAAN